MHQWEKRGDYQIMVKAKDEHGLQTAWSDTFIVTMPKTRQIIGPRFQRILEHFLLFQNLFKH